MCGSSLFLGITEIEGGFPHSEILGSKPVRGSPRLIAAYHVLHSLSAPRHPPDTLKTLDRSHYRCPSHRSASAEGNDAMRGRSHAGHDRKDQFAQTCPGALRSSDARRLEVRMIGNCSKAGSKALPVRPDMFPLHDVWNPQDTDLSVGTCETCFGRPCAGCGDRPSGGARRDRTDDLMLAKHALSQLSYGPVDGISRAWKRLVGLGGLEPPTSRLSSARSNQLSYKPEPWRMLFRTRKRRSICPVGLVLEERETKAAEIVPQNRPDWP